jgi:hypothetical protein
MLKMNIESTPLPIILGSSNEIQCIMMRKIWKLPFISKQHEQKDRSQITKMKI